MDDRIEHGYNDNRLSRFPYESYDTSFRAFKLQSRPFRIAGEWTGSSTASIH